ncbi:TIGR04282 family arsenosugar biosynthesis glycosyltransferase [Nonlabens ponticola]|uniref:Glycosyltransferase n=1 Tax=Nonlabens ponticola TaxID=2496866 RepID=A0A3S9MUG9_9FLAO|nr:TIGR04282 family arsenosugar biosynthesis glycosyltransferase [Nonlabens ponticola]AZQ42824.1 glycosyltransferase [Nonlabens ponticola]
MTNCLIIFTRNPELGKGKRRLAATLGDEKALEIYKFLLDHTRSITKNIYGVKQVWYSERVHKDDDWDNLAYEKYQQQGNDLGERMRFAFEQALERHQSVIIIGSDMYDLTALEIDDAFKKLNEKDAVIGPAMDGGYYLLGFRDKIPNGIFENKDWGTSTVLEKTLKDLEGLDYAMLEERNDVDTEDDVKDHPDFQLLLD